MRMPGILRYVKFGPITTTILVIIILILIIYLAFPYIARNALQHYIRKMLKILVKENKHVELAKDVLRTLDRSISERDQMINDFKYTTPEVAVGYFSYLNEIISQQDRLLKSVVDAFEALKKEIEHEVSDYTTTANIHSDKKFIEDYEVILNNCLDTHLDTNVIIQHALNCIADEESNVYEEFPIIYEYVDFIADTKKIRKNINYINTALIRYTEDNSHRKMKDVLDSLIHMMKSKLTANDYRAFCDELTRDIYRCFSVKDADMLLDMIDFGREYYNHI